MIRNCLCRDEHMGLSTFCLPFSTSPLMFDTFHHWACNLSLYDIQIRVECCIEDVRCVKVGAGVVQWQDNPCEH